MADRRPLTGITIEEVQHRFGYHRADQQAAEQHAAIREAYILLGSVVAQAVPAGREQALAMTALQESMMWANAGVAMLSPVAPDPRSVT